MNPSVGDIALQRIHDSGGRITVPTRLVVSLLALNDRHLTADDLIDALQRNSPGIAPSTVYRVLQRLDELDLLEHVHSGAGPAFYHLRERSHAHLVCTECRAVTDVADDATVALHRFGAAVRASHGFTLDPHHIAFSGRCATCAGNGRRTPTEEPVTEFGFGDELTAAHRG